MIKVDIISGFLGAGKTTFIKRMGRILGDSGERLVIIENEFGEAGIDGEILEMNGLVVYELSQGCICCTLKSDLNDTLVKIAETIAPDRVIIEPSGIFALSEIYDVFKNPDIQHRMQLNALITLVDSYQFLKQRKRYGFFFQNQIHHTKRVVLSKSEGLSRDGITEIVDAILEIEPDTSIHAAPWSKMTDSEFIDMVSGDQVPEGHVQSHFIVRHNLKKHKAFTSVSMKPLAVFSKDALSDALHKLSDPESYGSVLRAKGFVDSTDGCLQFNFVDGCIDIEPVSGERETKICVIGENLNKYALFELFGAN